MKLIFGCLIFLGGFLVGFASATVGQTRAQDMLMQATQVQHQLIQERDTLAEELANLQTAAREERTAHQIIADTDLDQLLSDLEWGRLSHFRWLVTPNPAPKLLGDDDWQRARIEIYDRNIALVKAIMKVKGEYDD